MAPGGGFKRCCLQTGEYDGSNRHYFFPGVAAVLRKRRELRFSDGGFASPHLSLPLFAQASALSPQRSGGSAFDNPINQAFLLPPKRFEVYVFLVHSIRQGERSGHRRNSSVAHVVDLSVWQVVQGLGILYLSVMAG